MKTIPCILVFVCLLSSATSQTLSSNTSQAEGPQTLFDTLNLVFLPPNAASLALFPIEVLFFQTPIVIRYVTFFALASYEPFAACHPTALSFFGVRDNIDPSFCEPLPRLIIFHYIFHQLVVQEFPDQANAIAIFLRENGLNPDSLSTDASTEIGWANRVAFRAQRYFRNDGWNSLGDLNRESFRQPYSDYTGYRPKNLAQKPVSDLRRPLRWQPQVQALQGSGLFTAQVHVVPHVGRAKALALTNEDFDMRISESPYSSPNRRDTLSKSDRALMEGMVRKYFRTSRQLTPQQRFEAAFWDNKLFSLGGFLDVYNAILNFTEEERAQWFMSEMVAQHDAVLVAWREKRRHDLVRPSTIIRKLWRGRLVRAFVNQKVGVKLVRAEEFEPLIPNQPHSEFPSGSALICAASLENLRVALDTKFGKNFTEPPFVLPVRSGRFLRLPDVGVDFDLVFNSLREAANRCGSSRLYAGVHFVSSVKEGLRLGRGIGRSAFRHVSSLVRGVVPQSCERCLRPDE